VHQLIYIDAPLLYSLYATSLLLSLLLIFSPAMLIFMYLTNPDFHRNTMPSSQWRRAGLSYLQYINISSSALRNCLKEPLKTQAKAKADVSFNEGIFIAGVKRTSKYHICMFVPLIISMREPYRWKYILQ
jgi:hypothetical protein